MKYEGVWVEGIEDDLTVLTEEQQEKLFAKFDSILKSPNTMTERIINWDGNIRKLRIGDHRLIISVTDPEQGTVYAVALRHRNHCYDKQTQREIEAAVNKAEQELILKQSFKK